MSMGKIQKNLTTCCVAFLLALSCSLTLADSADSVYIGVDSTPVTLAVSAGQMSYSVIYLGYTSNASNNSLQVSNIGTILTDTDGIYIGYDGSSNVMSISAGATEENNDQAYLGYNSSADNNSVLVTGEGSLWRNSDSNVVATDHIIYVGYSGSGNTVTLTDRGKIIAYTIDIGTQDSASNNSLNIGSLGGNDKGGLLEVGSISFGSGTNNAINFNQTDTFTCVADISGNGFVNQLGSGTTILSQSNNYQGVTTIRAGVLIAANASACGESSVNLGGGSGLAILSMESNIVNFNIASLSWASNSLISMRLGSQVVNVTGSITNADSSPKNLLFINSSLDNSTNAFMTFASQSDFTTNSFSTPGVVGYSFMLTSTTASAYINTNTDLILSTNKEINTSFTSASLLVATNGILSGTGVYTGNLINKGLLAPGNPIGTLTVNGNVNLNTVGTLQINVESPTDYGNLQVNGSVDLAGTLEVAPLGSTPLTYGEKLTFINSTGPIKGAFQTVQIDQSYCRGRVTIIGDPQATVTIAPTSYTYVAQNQNQTNVALALNSFIPATSGDALVVSTDLDSLTEDQYPGAFNAIMPTLYQSLSTIAFSIDNAQNQEMIQRLWGIRLANANEHGGHFSMSGLAENTPLLEGEKSKNVQDDILRQAPNNHWGIFVDGNGIFAKANSANLLPTYNAQSGGVTTGLSYAWNKCFTTGLYTGYEGVYSKYSGGSTLVDNQVNFGLFGTYGQKEGKGVFVDGLIGGAYDNYQMNRNISFGSGDNALNRTAMGTPGAGELNTMVATGYDIKRGHFTFGPLSSLQYQYFGTSPFTESGADSLNLSANSWNTSSMIFSLGSHLAYNWQVTKNLLLIPQVSLNWQHQFLENPYTINSTLNSGSSPSFANTSSAPLRDTLYTGLGFTIEMGQRWESSFFYNAAAGNQDLVSQNIFWSLGCKF